MSEFNPTDSTLIYYGPHACGDCYPDKKGEPGSAVTIVKVSREQGGAEFDYPDGPIYPNTVWVPHVHRS